MSITRLAHNAIRTPDLEGSRRFFVEVLGLRAGYRPPFDFPGYWLYSGEPPADLHNGARNYGLVHLMGWDDANPGSLDAYVGERKVSEQGGTGALDHVAFAASGHAAMLERCRRFKVKFHERDVPLMGLRQVFVQDPDGVTIELNFPASEVAKAA